MKNSANLVLVFVISALCGMMLPANAARTTGDIGDTGGGPTKWNGMMYRGVGAPVGGLAPVDQGGGAETKDQAQPLEDSDLAKASAGKSTIGDAQTGLPASAIKLKWPKGAAEAMKRNMANTDGRLPTNSEMQLYLANFAGTLAAGANAPDKQMHSAKANLDAQGTEVANGMADLEKQQAASAIDFCSSFLNNFTTDGGNKWNKLRDNIFMPMAVLLLLPGAILTQVKAIISAGTPVLGQETNPFEGIQRSLIAIFLIPGTYLVLNYSIDLNNSVTYSIAEEYTRLFGSDMYRDAISFHIRAFPSRQPGENRNALDQQTAKMTPLLGGKTAFALFEGKMIENKIEDPVAKIYQAPMDRADEALPSSAIMAKTMFNSTNATFMIAWNILCAFQMVYFYYLWFVGPITAALWAWPMKTLRNAFPSWCEGVITLGFWSLFWNTSILLMACFRGVDETGTLILTALNFLATSSVKYAFDFAGLAKAAGQEAAQMAEKAMNAAKGGGGGGGGGGGKGGHAGHKGGHGHGTGHQPHHPHHAGEALPGGPKVADAGEGKRELAGLPLNDRLVALNKDADERGGRIRVASLDPDAGFRELAAKQPPPPIDGDDKAVRQLPGDSFTVGDGGSGGHMFTRSMVDGKPVLTVTDMEGNAVKGMDGKDLGPISLSDIPENGSKSISFDPDPTTGKPRGSIDIQQGSHGGQLYHASSHGHSELVSYSGGHLSGHSSAAVDAGMHASMMDGKPVAELQPGLFYGTDANGNGALYDIDHNQINFDANGDATLADGRSLHMEDGPDGYSTLSVNGSDLYALSASNAGLSVSHGDATHDPYHHPINSLALSRDANGAVHSSLFNENGQRTESATMFGADTQRAYYNPDSQALLGYSNTHNFDNGDSVTNFYRDDNSLVGTNMYQMTDDGFRETVFDASGNPVSMQQTSYDDNGYSLTTANFVDGNVSNASVSQFDNSGTFLSSQPLDYRQMQSIGGDVSALSQYSNSYSQGVVPDGNVFGSTPSRSADGYTVGPPAQQVEVANNYSTPFTSGKVDVVPPQMFDPKTMAEQKIDYATPQAPQTWAKVEAPALNSGSNDAPKVMPVDIAGTQLPSSKDFSQIDGAYAANQSSQGQYAEVAYSNPVVTSSVDIMPPQVLDTTPMAYQQAELAAPSASLESQMANQVGGLSVTADNSATSFTFNDNNAPPTGGFVAREAAPDIQATVPVPGAGQNNTVLPVDIAGTQLNDNKAALELSQNSQIEGAYAANQSSQGQTAEVAYSSPVTTSSVEVAPPIALDSTPMSYQQAELNAPKASLESQMAHQVGGLSVTSDTTANTFNFGDAQGPPASSFVSKDSAPDVNHFAAVVPQNNTPQNNTVLPVDIAGTQGAGENKAAFELAQNAQIQGAYAANNSSQGQTAEVAYSTPVTTSNIDIAPPIVLDQTPIANPQYDSLSVPPSLETVMSHQVGNVSAGTENIAQADAPQVAMRDAAPADQTYVTHAPHYGDSTYTNPVTTSQVDVVPPGVVYDNDQTVLNQGSVNAQQPEVSHAGTPVYGQPRTESVAQLASAAALASNAQQNLLGEPKVEHRTTHGPGSPAMPKRGLGTIFSDITMGKKTVKPGQKDPKMDPNVQQKGGVVAQPGQLNDPNAPGKPVDATKLMGKMRNTVDAETTMQMSTGQSLEKQMIQAGSHVQAVPSNTLNSILGKTSAAVPQKPSEHLNNALVDYHTVAALIHEGKTNEAALVSGNALANISRCSGTEPQLLPLVRAFVELFNQKHMIHQAKAFAEKEKALDELAKTAAAANKNDNVWGS
ncbi:MAG: hypothetical protein U0103_00445 [Candidatus Obscuribacterales bacterium]